MSASPLKIPVHGWLVLDKPQGLTSTQALGKVRRLVAGKKAGHGGTLDPLATGVLPLAFGEATKVIPYVMDGDKEYEFTVRWGEARDTDDAEGQVTATSPMRPTAEAIQAALPHYIGTINQLPPRFSAIKVDGERAYDLARAGAEVELKPRPVNIYDLKLIGLDSPDAARFWVACGKGMYVRSLARDLALELGTFGHVTVLRRLKAGPFRLEQAISLEKLTALSHIGDAHKALLAIRMALDDIPVLQLTASEAQRLRAGQSLMIRPQHMDLVSMPVIWAEHQGVPVALVAQQSGAFHVMRGFHF